LAARPWGIDKLRFPELQPAVIFRAGPGGDSPERDRPPTMTRRPYASRSACVPRRAAAWRSTRRWPPARRGAPPASCPWLRRPTRR
ncbi:MAG TPA: hypothetical protein VGB74_14310, partial [Actinoplanes sp.]